MASQHGGATAEEFIPDTDESTYRVMLQEALQQNWEGGFCRMPDVVRQDRTLSPKAKIVYEQLLAHMWFSTDHCWPSQQTIAAETGYSRRTVIRACKELYERGYIEKWRRGQGYTNYYFINPLTFPHSFKRTTREPVETMIVDVHTPELRMDVSNSTPRSFYDALALCQHVTSRSDNGSHPEVTECHPKQTKENQIHEKERSSNDSTLPQKGMGFPVAVQTTRNEHEAHVQTTNPQQVEQSALQQWRNTHYANQPDPVETQRHASESRKHHEPGRIEASLHNNPSKQPNSSARSCSQGNVPERAKEVKDDTRCEQQTKQAAIAALTGIPEQHLQAMGGVQGERRRPIPAFISNMMSHFSHELGDNPWCEKSNITQTAKLYFFACMYIIEAQHDPQGYFLDLLYQAKEDASHVTNVRYRNSAGRPNRMPVFFTCLKNEMHLSEEELLFVRSDELLYE